MNEKEFGLVLYGNGNEYTVLYKNHEVVARLKRKLLHTTKRSHHPVCPGDHVVIVEQEPGSYHLESVLPRKNKISRPSNNHMYKEQVLVSNIDCVFLVTSIFSPPFNDGFLDRLIVFCEREKVPFRILVNKCDNEKSEDDEYMIEGYQSIGIPVDLISVKNGQGLTEIKDFMQGKIVAFIGNSGVGKSSLLNKVAPEACQKISETSDYSLKGRHTTKQARLFRTANEGCIIDTPGIKEFGLWELPPKELKNYFREMAALSDRCKYYNCLHLNEPNCAVTSAVDEGTSPDFRYENYLKIYETLLEQKEIFYKAD